MLLVASMDIPSIKNLKVGIQTLDLLSLAGRKLHLVLNRANAKVHLDIADVERALGVTAEFRIPSDIAIPQAVNRGVPVVLDKPRSPAALALGELADSFLGVGSPAAAEAGEPTSRTAPARHGGVATRRSRSCRSSTPAGRTSSSSPASARTLAARRAAAAGPPVRHRAARSDAHRRAPGRARDAPLVSGAGAQGARRGERRSRRARAGRSSIQDVTDDALGYGPIDRFLKDDGHHRGHGERPEVGLHRATKGKIEQDRRRVRRRDAPPPHDRQDREPGRPAHRRGDRRWSTPACPTAPV